MRLPDTTMTTNEVLALRPGDRVYLNTGEPVTVVRTEKDPFGFWVIYDAGTFDREQVEMADIHRTPPVKNPRG